MIKIKTDISTVLNQEADFSEIAKKSPNVETFTTECGIELKSAVLGAVVAAQDEYIRIIQSMTPNELPVDLKASLKESLFSFVKDITNDDLAEFREMVTG